MSEGRERLPSVLITDPLELVVAYAHAVQAVAGHGVRIDLPSWGGVVLIQFGEAARVASAAMREFHGEDIPWPLSPDQEMAIALAYRERQLKRAGLPGWEEA